MRSPCRYWRSVARRRAGLQHAGDSRSRSCASRSASARTSRISGWNAPLASPESAWRRPSVQSIQAKRAAITRDQRRAAGEDEERQQQEVAGGRLALAEVAQVVHQHDRADRLLARSRRVVTRHVDAARTAARASSTTTTRPAPRSRMRVEQRAARELGGVGVGRGEQLAARRAGGRAHDALVAGDAASSASLMRAPAVGPLAVEAVVGGGDGEARAQRQVVLGPGAHHAGEQRVADAGEGRQPDHEHDEELRRREPSTRSLSQSRDGWMSKDGVLYVRACRSPTSGSSATVSWQLMCGATARSCGAACRASTRAPIFGALLDERRRAVHHRAGDAGPGRAALPGQHQRPRDDASSRRKAPSACSTSRRASCSTSAASGRPSSSASSSRWPARRASACRAIPCSAGRKRGRTARLGSHHISYRGFPTEVRLTTDAPLSYLDGEPFALTERKHFVLLVGRAGRGAARAAVRALPAARRSPTGGRG